MTSTVIDAALCLLLVSGAVVAVTGATPEERERGRDADAVVNTLSTTTASVSFERDGREVSRHATLSGHLTAAVRSRVELVGRPVTGGRDNYVAGVREAVAAAIGRETQVIAVWRPYPDARLSARFVVGPSPPPDAAVHAETMLVPSGLPPVRNASRLDSNVSVGRRVADAVVAGLFPTDELGYALDDPAVAPLARERYVRAGASLGVETPEKPTSDDVRPLNDRFATVLGTRLGTHIERQAGGARAVNDAISTETAVVTVRTWS